MKNYNSLFTVIISLLLTSCMIPDRNKELDKEYIRLSRDTTITGVADTFFWYQLSYPRGSFFITLTNGLKFRGTVSTIPYEMAKGEDVNKYFLYPFLSKGDTVRKPAGKDSLYVFKNGKQYTFFLPTKEFNDSVFHRKKKTD